MKKALLYLLMVTYALDVIKPTLPFVYDAVAHAIFYQHHITSVHMVNGKQHVHHEFVQAAKKENSGNNSSSLKKIIPTEDHLFLPFYYKPPTAIFVELRFKAKIINLSLRSISTNFPPPKQQLV